MVSLVQYADLNRYYLIDVSFLSRFGAYMESGRIPLVPTPIDRASICLAFGPGH